MGSSYEVYIGPYIEVKGKIKKQVEKVKRVCKNHPKEKFNNEKYCSKCGELIITEDYVEEISMSIDDFLCEIDGDFNDHLWYPYYLNHKNTIFLPNKKIPNGYKIPNSYEGGVAELNNLDYITTNQKIWVENEYKKYLDLIKQEIGENKVEVKWGCVGYWI